MAVEQGNFAAEMKKLEASNVRMIKGLVVRDSHFFDLFDRAELLPEFRDRDASDLRVDETIRVIQESQALLVPLQSDGNVTLDTQLIWTYALSQPRLVVPVVFNEQTARAYSDSDIDLVNLGSEEGFSQLQLRLKNKLPDMEVHTYPTGERQGETIDEEAVDSYFRSAYQILERSLWGKENSEISPNEIHAIFLAREAGIMMGRAKLPVTVETVEIMGTFGRHRKQLRYLASIIDYEGGLVGGFNTLPPVFSTEGLSWDAPGMMPPDVQGPDGSYGPYDPADFE